MLPARTGMLILVASSDEDARRICTTCLRHAGYDVLPVDDADRVLVDARQARPDLIITSHPTRTSTGEAVTGQVRRDPALASTPILNLASRVMPAELAAAEAEGVTASLAMPVDIDALLDVVRRLVGPAPPPQPDSGMPDVAPAPIAGRGP